LLGLYKFAPYGTKEDWILYAKNIHDENKLPTYLYAEYRDKETADITTELILKLE